MTELPFRIATGVLLLAFGSVRAYYALGRRGGGRTVGRRGGGRTVGRRRPLDVAVVTGVAVSLGLLGAYALLPLPTMFALPVPGALRWAGAAVFAAGTGVVWWAHHALGRNWSVMPQAREGQAMVVTGPYRLVRHPMYSGIFLTAFGALLLTADWLAGGAYLLSVSAMYASRVRSEEEALEKRFGDAYCSFMERTPRLVPRPRSR